MKSQEIVKMLRETGPQTGWQLLEQTHMEALPLWQLCRQTPEVRFECIGKRFVRLDRAVEGYARLSPSIRREFLTYTILGLESQTAAIDTKALQLRQEIRKISQAKRDLAREAMADIVESLPEWESMRNKSALSSPEILPMTWLTPYHALRSVPAKWFEARISTSW